MSISTVNMTGNPDIDGLLSGVRWAGDVMSYGFPTNAGAYGAYAHNVDDDKTRPRRPSASTRPPVSRH